MLNNSALLTSNRARAARHAASLLRKVCADQVRSARYWLNPAERHRDQVKARSLRDLEDYYEFASHRFGMLQIKPEMLDFLRYARIDSPRNVCEIGASPGGTAFLLSQSLPSVSLFVGIDVYVQNRTQMTFLSKPSQRICIINGPSAWRRTRHALRQALDGRQLDLLFIDGDHSYAGVARDFLLYRGLVRHGGLIAFHDIVPDHRSRYGTDTLGWSGGVPQLWDTLKQSYEYREFIRDASQDGFGIGVMRYSETTPITVELA